PHAQRRIRLCRRPVWAYNPGRNRLLHTTLEESRTGRDVSWTRFTLEGGSSRVQTQFLLRVRLTNRTLALARLDEQALLRGLRAALSQGTNSVARLRWHNSFRRGSSHGTRRQTRAAPFD